MNDAPVIGAITPDHYDEILRLNAKFVHWLSPLDRDGLMALLGVATYTRQIGDGAGCLIGYGHDVDYDHKNLRWLRARFDGFFYIDRVIIAEQAHGRSYGRWLYEDFEAEARKRGYPRLVCEVNTVPDNPGSHRFHERMGFQAIGEQTYPAFNNAAVRYYEKTLS